MITKAPRESLPCRRGHMDWTWAERSGRPRGEWKCRTCANQTKKARRDKIREGTAQPRHPGPTDWPKGYHHQPAPPVARIPVGYVRNDQIRDAVTRALRWDPDLTPGEIAQRCGWTHSRKINGGDTTRVYRILGMTLYMDKKARGGFAYRQLIAESDVVALCRAIHVDPWEVGL